MTDDELEVEETYTTVRCGDMVETIMVPQIIITKNKLTEWYVLKEKELEIRYQIRELERLLPVDASTR